MSEEEKNKNVDKNNQHRNSENSEQNNDNEENTEESKKENNDNARESKESKEPEDTDETGQSESKKSSLDNVKYQREVSFLENSRDLSYQSLPSMDSNLTETGYTDSITYGEGYIEPTDKVLYPRLKEELFPEDEDLTSDPLRNAVAERRISETTMITHKAIAKQYGSYGNRYAKRDSSKIYGTDSVLYTELREEGHFLYFILPPDGGTGWIVTLISFLCQLLVSGILYAIGPILPHISADLGLSDVKVTLIPTVQIGLFFLCMPFSTALFNSYGFYRINLCGASFAAIAMFGASYCTQIETLLLSFSILGGPALSILYISSILRISLFFQKYRSLAYAMTCSGTGAGLVVFFFVNNYILAEYNWRQVMKCHSILFGILFLILLKRVKITPKRIFKIEIPTTSLGSMMVEEFPREVPVRKLSDVHTITFENKKIGELFVPFTPPTVFTPGLSERILLAPCKFEDVHVYSSNHILKPDLIEIKDIFYTGPVKYIFPEDAFLLLQESSLFLIANEDDVNAYYTLYSIHGMESANR
ncbi:uncharacterized protein LOC119684743 isoform X2 [Teleopsis dalmanni]|uniref:uncharacterized protein LOC119684743 isoform X2 n=1 Tax=Teleopsis dalmanni TaxID=139649 RepID=UPI0018CFDF60|nr:uncharacterized protein LOC119684743 isoform X2 [Teleopsis dalmanni]